MVEFSLSFDFERQVNKILYFYHDYDKNFYHDKSVKVWRIVRMTRRSGCFEPKLGSFITFITPNINLTQYRLLLQTPHTMDLYFEYRWSLTMSGSIFQIINVFDFMGQHFWFCFVYGNTPFKKECFLSGIAQITSLSLVDAAAALMLLKR